VADTLKLSTDNLRKIEEVGPPNRAVRDDSASDKPAASDVWGIGALLVAALAAETQGRPSEQQLTLIPGSVPEPFRRIARECLRPNPNDRCTLEQIKDWINTNQVLPETGANASELVTRRSGRLQRMGIPIAALVALAAVVLALNWRSKAPKAEPAESVQTTPAAQTSSAATAQERTVAGAVAERVQPNVSQGARNTIQGKIRVTVRVAVDSGGKVTDAKLISAGPSKYFANQALESARKWKFTAPQIGGQPVSSAWL